MAGQGRQSYLHTRPPHRQPGEPGRSGTAPPAAVNLGKLALVFTLYAGLFFATAAWFGGARLSQRESVPAGVPYGPVRTEQVHTVLEISVSNPAPENGWTAVTADLLDRDNNAIISFAGETFHESGVDADGQSWTEKRDRTGIRVVIPDPGVYFLRFRVESGSALTGPADVTGQTNLDIRIRHLRGSNGHLTLIGCILLAAGLILNEIQNLTFLRYYFREDA